MHVIIWILLHANSFPNQLWYWCHFFLLSFCNDNNVSIILWMRYYSITNNISVEDSTKIFTKCLFYLSTCDCFNCISSTDESLCWCNSRYTDWLFNHPPPASKPFPSGKARRHCEPSSWCVSWVILQHIQALAVCINIFDKWRGKNA